jgi:hypothetical protein
MKARFTSEGRRCPDNDKQAARFPECATSQRPFKPHTAPAPPGVPRTTSRPGRPLPGPPQTRTSSRRLFYGDTSFNPADTLENTYKNIGVPLLEGGATYEGGLLLSRGARSLSQRTFGRRAPTTSTRSEARQLRGYRPVSQDDAEDFPRSRGGTAEDERGVRQTRPGLRQRRGSARSFADEQRGSYRGLRAANVDYASPAQPQEEMEEDRPQVTRNRPKNVRLPQAPRSSTSLLTQSEYEERERQLQSLDDAFKQSQQCVKQTRSELTQEEEDPNEEIETYDEGQELDAIQEEDLAEDEGIGGGDEGGGDGGGGGEAEGELGGEEIGGDLGGDVAGEVGAEGAAGAVEAAGGEVDPLQDIVAGGIALVGGVLALQGAYMKWWSGDEPYLGIKETQKMTGKGTMYLQFRKSSLKHITDMYKQYLGKAPKGGYTQSHLTALTPTQKRNIAQAWAYMGRITQAVNNSLQGNGDPPVMYTYKNSDGKKQTGFSIPLNKQQIAQAIQVYRSNPDAFKNIPKQALAIMGLNSSMTLGKDGATQLSDGTYLPKNMATSHDLSASSPVSEAGFSSTNNTNAFLSYALRKKNGIASDPTKNYFDSNTPSTGSTASQQTKQAQQAYSSSVQSQISGETDPHVKQYMAYQLNLWKYNQGLTSTKPTAVAPPLTPAEQQKVTQYQQQRQSQIASYRRQLQQDQQTETANQNALTHARNALASTGTQQQVNQYNANLMQNLQSYSNQVAQYDLQTAQQATQPTQLLQANVQQMYNAQKAVYHAPTTLAGQSSGN